MNFALVGQSDESRQLADVIKKSRDHQIVATFPLVAEAERAWTQAKLNPVQDSWESLLQGSVADAVILSPNDHLDLQADCMRKLAQAAVPMWVIHPAGESILGYEIEMICRDSLGVVVPHLPAVHHPAVARLVELTQAVPHQLSGLIERVSFDRPLRDRDRRTVLHQLSRDVQLVRMLVGEVRQVAAMDSAEHDPSYTNLSVQMRSADGAVVTWSVSPAGDSSVATLELVAVRDTVRLRMPEDVDNWTIESSSGEFDWRPAAPVNLADVALDCFVKTVNGASPSPDWSDACRDIEVAEAVPESLRRRRTIDLLYEEHSEQATFMGMMAIGGCGLLLFSSMFLLVAGIVEGLRLPFREHPLWRIWPVYLLVPLALFLLLQLLRFVFPGSEPGGEEEMIQPHPVNFDGPVKDSGATGRSG